MYFPTVIQYFLAFAFLITVVVFIHELGHYSIGKWCGIGVETFSIGMGKQIWGKRDKSGTLWRIAILPIGGYVKFYGDEDPTGKKSHSNDDKANDQNFHNKSFNFIKIECIKEKNLMGTGGALYNLKQKKINDFVLTNGDSIFNIDLKVNISPKTLAVSARVKGVSAKSNPCLFAKY